MIRRKKNCTRNLKSENNSVINSAFITQYFAEFLPNSSKGRTFRLREGEELQGEIKSAHKSRCPDAISLCTGGAIIKEPLHVALLHGLQAIAHFTRHHRHFRIDLPTSIRIRRRLFKWINPLDVSINSAFAL